MPTIRLELGISGLSTNDVLESFGPMLFVEIGYFDQSSQAIAAVASASGSRYPALIDTGARESAVDSSLAEELGLAVSEDMERQAVSILGVGTVNEYFAQISIPELGFSIAGRFPGVHLAEGGQPYSALIGRDILRNFTMVYDGRTGAVSLSNE